MPVVEVYGQELEFPDEMPPEQIKAVLQKKFPTPKPVVDVPEPANPVNDMMAGIIKSLAGRTGRIATGIAASPLDLPVMVGQSAYDATRGVQQAMGADVAPAYKIPLPSEGAKQLYDMATNNAGKVNGEVPGIDQAAEIVAPLGAAATKIIPAAAKQLVPRAQGAVRSLAQRAQELGVPLRVDQVAPSRAINTAQKISQEIPLSGVDTSEANQMQAWNKALAKTLGQDADNLSPEIIQKFRKDAAIKFSNTLTGQNINIDPSDVSKIKNIAQVAPNSLGADSLAIVNSNIKLALQDIKTVSYTHLTLPTIYSV